MDSDEKSVPATQKTLSRACHPGISLSSVRKLLKTRQLSLLVNTSVGKRIKINGLSCWGELGIESHTSKHLVNYTITTLERKEKNGGPREMLRRVATCGHGTERAATGRLSGGELVNRYQTGATVKNGLGENGVVAETS